MTIITLLPLILVAAIGTQKPISCSPSCDFLVPKNERVVSIWTEDWKANVDTAVSQTAGWRSIRITSSRVNLRTSHVSIKTNKKTYFFKIITGLEPKNLASTEIENISP